MSKVTYLLVPLVAVMTGACGVDLGFADADPRVGDRGVLAFRSEGCTSTTVMAVGSRASLRLETVDGGPLPGDLTFTTSSPDVIEAASSETAGEIVLAAKAEGKSYLSVKRLGMLLDGIALQAAIARSVRSRSVDRVVLGGHADVVVDDVMGLCDGQLCELFGTGFLTWRSEPADALTLVAEQGRVTSFVASGDGSILGREPARSADLVKAAIVTVAATEITGWSASIVAVDAGGGERSTIPLPATVPAHAYLCLRLDARHPDGDVPLSRRDVTWSLDDTVLEPIEAVDEPLCTLVVMGDPGPATLRASSPLFAEQPSFDVVLE